MQLNASLGVSKQTSIHSSVIAIANDAEPSATLTAGVSADGNVQFIQLSTREFFSNKESFKLFLGNIQQSRPTRSLSYLKCC
jgi:hypothetical protein